MSAGAFYDPELIRCKIPEKKKNQQQKKSLEGQSGDGKEAISRFFPARGEEFTKNRGIGRKYFDFSARFEAPGEARRGFGVISRRNGIFLWFYPGGLGRKKRILGLFFAPPGPNLAEWRGNKGEGSSKNWSEGGKLNLKILQRGGNRLWGRMRRDGEGLFSIFSFLGRSLRGFAAAAGGGFLLQLRFCGKNPEKREKRRQKKEFFSGRG